MSSIIIAGFPGMGKDINIETPVLTPNGWKKAKEIKIGDNLIGQDGKSTKVIGVFPQGILDKYEIIFNDNTKTNCGIDHLWQVAKTINKKTKEPKWEVLSLRDILKEGVVRKYGDKIQSKWKIPLTKPVQFKEKKHIIDSYILGALIGNGYLCGNYVEYIGSNEDVFVINKIQKLVRTKKILFKDSTAKGQTCKHYRFISKKKPNIFRKEIIRLGLNVKSGGKFIPKEYMFDSVKNRIKLLNGLMDTDGTSKERNRVNFCTTSKQLVSDIIELIQSLGGMAWYHEYNRIGRVRKVKDKEYVTKSIDYIVTICLNDICPFSLPRKAKNWRKTNFNKYIISVKKIQPTESVCFMVDNKDGLFLLENYIVTHNTSLYNENKINYSDSDSSKFSKKYFPKNYIKHIKKIRTEKQLVFVSSHIDVRNELVKEKIPFIYVIPTLDRKIEFLENYKNRGNTQEFIDNVSINWDRWLMISAYNNEYPVYACKYGYLKDNLEGIIKEYCKFYKIGNIDWQV